MALWPIFEVCAKETGYEGGGELCKPWWQQEAADQRLKGTLKNISAAAGERRRQESDRRGRGEGGEGIRSWVVRGERREGDGFSVFWDEDGGCPYGWMILWWLCWRQTKDDGGGGGISDCIRRGWGGSNK